MWIGQSHIIKLYSYFILSDLILLGNVSGSKQIPDNLTNYLNRIFNFSNPVGVHQLIYIAVLSLIAVNSKKYVTRKKYIGYYLLTTHYLIYLEY